MKLNRHHIFLIGLFTGLAFCGIHILNFHLKSDFAKGKLVAWEGHYPRISFEVNSTIYEFMGESNLEFENSKEIDLIYDKTNPENAAVYTFIGFYMFYFYFLILPLVLFAAFIYSWFDKYDYVTINFKKRKISKSREIMKVD